jgi:hypothetical protein
MQCVCFNLKIPINLADDVRHFSDNLILARMEAEKEEGKQALGALDEDHLIQTLADIFFGEFVLKISLIFRHFKFRKPLKTDSEILHYNKRSCWHKRIFCVSEDFL